MSITLSAKEITIDFNLPLLNVDKSNMTVSELQRTIKRYAPSIVTVKGNPESQFVTMLEVIKTWGIRIVHTRVN